MNYITKSELLMHHQKKLNKNQIQELKKIILFDIWIGNKDRHTANIFINDNLIAFDHEKIFNKGRARQFIKIDTGRKLNKDFVDIIEKLIDKKSNTKDVLMKLGFKEDDFPKIRKEETERIIKNKKILKFLCLRTDFSKIEF